MNRQQRRAARAKGMQLKHGGRTVEFRVYLNTDADEQELHRRSEILHSDPFRGPRGDQILIAGGFVSGREADTIWKSGGTEPEKLLHDGRTAQLRIFMNTDADEAELGRRVALLSKSRARAGIDGMVVVVGEVEREEAKKLWEDAQRATENYEQRQGQA